MAIKTTLSQIEEVQTAITAVMAGQSYKIGNMTYTRASLSSLQEREDSLLTRYYREQGNNPRVSRSRYSEASYRSGGGTNDRVS